MFTGLRQVEVRRAGPIDFVSVTEESLSKRQAKCQGRYYNVQVGMLVRGYTVPGGPTLV